MSFYNRKIWPKADVEPRKYRMHFLNGCDSRFLVIQFVAVAPGVTDPEDDSAFGPIAFWVIGSDQGLGDPQDKTTLVMEPGGRYDIVFDFATYNKRRVIIKNLGGDSPFGGDYGDELHPDDFYDHRLTDRVMAFDVSLDLDKDVEDKFILPLEYPKVPYAGADGESSYTRRVALFEGLDEYDRLQPLLGTVKKLDDDSQDSDDESLDEEDVNVAKAYTWFQETTETPYTDTIEIWEIFNLSADAHPIHLHLVHFEILDRETFEYTITDVQKTTQHTGDHGYVAVSVGR